MIVPKQYKFNADVAIEVLLKNGFELHGNMITYKTTLYKYDNSNVPYVELFLCIEDRKTLNVSVLCGGNNIYIPFINPEARYNNAVYEKIASNYNNIMDKFVKKKILRHARVREKKHGRNNQN